MIRWKHMITRVARWTASMLAVLLMCQASGCLRPSANAPKTPIQVFAASSLTDAMNQIREDFERQSPYRVELTLDSSATLAKQIENGAPADIFISANREWAQYAYDKSADRATPPQDLLSNRLVLVTGRDTLLKVTRLEDLANVADLQLALGNPESVPAGIYAKQVLEKLQLWESFKDRVLPADNVRAALQYVETGSALAAIVYATDVSSSSSVRQVLEIDPSLHEPIVYPLVRIRQDGDRTHVQAFLDFLESAATAKHFTDLGFQRISENGP